MEMIKMINRFLFLVVIAAGSATHYNLGAAAYMPHFKIDDRVDNNITGGKNGIIKKVLPNESNLPYYQAYEIVYDNGKVERAQEGELIRAVVTDNVSVAAYIPQFTVGEQVEVGLGQGSKKERVTIVEILNNESGYSDGQFYVVMNGRGEERPVLEAQLRRMVVTPEKVLNAGGVNLAGAQGVHLLSDNIATLERDGLWPLIIKGEAEGQEGKYPCFTGLYSLADISEGEIRGKPRYKMNSRALYQINTIDQFKLAGEMGDIAPEVCSLDSVNNALLMNEYFRTGKIDELKKIKDESIARSFLLHCASNMSNLKYPTIDQVQKCIDDTLGGKSGMSNIGVIDLDLDLIFEGGYSFLSVMKAAKDLYQPKVQEVLEGVRNGLRQESFYYSLIFGEGRVDGADRHYFVLSLVKKGDQIQHVVIDTDPRSHYINTGSSELKSIDEKNKKRMTQIGSLLFYLEGTRSAPVLK